MTKLGPHPFETPLFRGIFALWLLACGLAHPHAHAFPKCLSQNIRTAARPTEAFLTPREKIQRRVAAGHPGFAQTLAKMRQRPAEFQLEDITSEQRKRMKHNLPEYRTEFILLDLPLVDNRSPDYVTVFRMLANTKPDQLDFDWNYRPGNRMAQFEEDYVARSIEECLKYMGDGPALLIRYEIPAVLLDYGKFVKPEASFTISARKLRQYGLPSPALFVAGIASIDRATKLAGSLPTPDYDFWGESFPNDSVTSSRQEIENSIRHSGIDSPYLKWMSATKLERRIQGTLRRPRAKRDSPQ